MYFDYLVSEPAMATVDSLASEMFNMKSELLQLRAHLDQQAAIQADTMLQQTNKTMSLDAELRSLYANADSAISKINTAITQMQGSSEKRKKKNAAEEQRHGAMRYDEKGRMEIVERRRRRLHGKHGAGT